MQNCETGINYITCNCLCTTDFAECQKKQNSGTCAFIKEQIEKQAKIFYEESLPELRLSNIMEL